MESSVTERVTKETVAELRAAYDATVQAVLDANAAAWVAQDAFEQSPTPETAAAANAAWELYFKSLEASETAYYELLDAEIACEE